MRLKIASQPNLVPVRKISETLSLHGLQHDLVLFSSGDVLYKAEEEPAFCFLILHGRYYKGAIAPLYVGMVQVSQ